MFNQYVWENYLNAGGKETVKIFGSLFNKDDNISILEIGMEYTDMIKQFHNSYNPNCDFGEDILFFFEELSKDLISSECVQALEISENDTPETMFEKLYNGIKETFNCSDSAIFGIFADNIAYYSTFLYFLYPDWFIPYYFRCNFNVLEKIAQEFNIELPPIPAKKDYLGRFYYYNEICNALYDFKEKHNMSVFELCAFLYDFAPKYIGGIDSYIISAENLPEPKSAFFIGAPADSADLKDEKDFVCAWQCNPDTRAGDMIVMYLRTPISAIDSVWRSVSIGFNDPFFYYYRCTYIANPVGINRITQKQLKEDAIFKNVPIVRKNMQGINGVELLPSQYNHLIDISKSDVLRLEFAESDSNLEFSREKDVENLLIKPLLKKLGYTDEDYVQQLHIEVGNHNFKLIPDFVILPKKKDGQYSAFAIIEAKLSIASNSILDDVKIQAKSYARQLNTKYSIIASKEKIWVSVAGKDNNYSEQIFTSTWNDLNNADTFSNLYKSIGHASK